MRGCWSCWQEVEDVEVEGEDGRTTRLRNVPLGIHRLGKAVLSCAGLIRSGQPRYPPDVTPHLYKPQAKPQLVTDRISNCDPTRLATRPAIEPLNTVNSIETPHSSPRRLFAT